MAPGRTDHRLTVVIPHFEHDAYFPTALASLEAQTRAPDAVLVIDDGSSVPSFTRLSEHISKSALAVRVVRNEENRGVIARLNDSLALVDTEYVSFLAADDSVADRCYELSTRLLNAYPQAPLCGVGVQWVDEHFVPMPQPGGVPAIAEARFYPADECRSIIERFGFMLDGNGTVYRTEHLEAAGGFDPALHAFTDGYRLHVLAMREGMCFEPSILAYWRRLGSSYAHRSRQRPHIATATVDRVRALAAGADADVFCKVETTRRFLGRVRFAAAAGLIGGSEEKEVAAAFLSILSDRGPPSVASGPHPPVVALVQSLGRVLLGRQLLLAFAFLKLRAGDFVFALRRRIR